MKKKFLVIIGSILCFLGLAFLITMRHSMPVLALGNVSISENDTFSNDLLVDLDYYSSFDIDSNNLFNANDYTKMNGWIEGSYKDYNLYHFNGVVGKTYTIKSFGFNIQVIKFANEFGESGGTEGPQNWSPFTTWTFTLTNHNTFILKYNNAWYHTGSPRIMIVEGSTPPSSYSAYYKTMFGFAIHSDNTTITKNLDFVESISNLGNTYYLPFDIASNGKISFNYTFPVGANVDFHSIVIKNKINGVVNDKIKLQYSYSNFSLGFKSITFIDDTPSSGDNWYGLIFQSDAPQVKIQSGKGSVYYSNFKSEVYNYLYASDFIDHTDYLYYGQVLGFGSYASDTNGKRTISFESFVCSSFGSGGGIVIPDNPDNDYEVYKPVSGPFDFQAMIYNAFTWIIFNVPVIGPILNVLRSARVMFSSVVSIGQLFTGFGVIFSIFIVCLILYIIKHLNGGD